MKHLSKLTLASKYAFSLAALLLAASNCGDDDDAAAPSNTCVKGQQIECACQGGLTGVQTCQADGTYAACVCEPNNGGSGGSSGASGSSGSDNGGSAGTAGNGGTAGTGGSNGGSSGTGGTGAGGTGAVAGSGGSGGSGGSAGTAGTAGTGGTVVVPQTCEEVHGEHGCCSNGGVYYYSFDAMQFFSCDNGTECGWVGGNNGTGYYWCVIGGGDDPSGIYPSVCGAPSSDANVCGTVPDVCESQPVSAGACATVSAATTCANAIDVTSALTTTGEYSGQTGGPGPGNTQGSCGGGETDPAKSFCGNAPEAVYKFTAPASGKYTFSLTTPGVILGQASACDDPLDAVLYIRTACSDTTTEMGCNNTATKNGQPLAVTIGEAQEVYIYVDGYGGDVGQFTLSMTSEPYCYSDADCAGDTPLCNVPYGVCVGCLTSFDCTDPTKPTCNFDLDGKIKCLSYDVCFNDDVNEPGNDGPSGAVNATPPAGNTILLSAGICDAPAINGLDGNGVESEQDWYYIDVDNGSSATITLDWATSDDLDMYVLDANSFYAMSLFRQPEQVNLTHLPAGRYYVEIIKFRTGTPSSSTVPYTLQVTIDANDKCTSDVDCRSSYETQWLRGHCNTSIGACEFIDGQGSVPQGEYCDSHGDCATGYCTYTLFGNSTSVPPYCTTYCVDDASCANNEYCDKNTDASYCRHQCADDNECPITLASSPPLGQSWSHLTCASNVSGTGTVCQY